MDVDDDKAARADHHSSYCWGCELSLGISIQIVCRSSAFRHHFCGHCIEHNVSIQVGRVGLITDEAAVGAAFVKNSSRGGVYNIPSPTAASSSIGSVPYRVVNNTRCSKGAKLVIFQNDLAGRAFCGVTKWQSAYEWLEPSVLFSVGATMKPVNAARTTRSFGLSSGSSDGSTLTPSSSVSLATTPVDPLASETLDREKQQVFVDELVGVAFGYRCDRLLSDESTEAAAETTLGWDMDAFSNAAASVLVEVDGLAGMEAAQDLLLGTFSPPASPPPPRHRQHPEHRSYLLMAVAVLASVVMFSCYVSSSDASKIVVDITNRLVHKSGLHKT